MCSSSAYATGDTALQASCARCRGVVVRHTGHRRQRTGQTSRRSAMKGVHRMARGSCGCGNSCFYHARDAVCLDSMKPSPNMSLQMPGARVTLFCHSFFPSVVAGLCLWPWSLLFGSEAEACPPAGAYTALTPLMLACLRAPACSSE
jgi:hypothetical protein